jgi:imidazolonepropionase-like amidohydrolase
MEHGFMLSDELLQLMEEKDTVIVATPENPLKDLQALRKVMFVMKNGKVFRYDK